jgi:hypothetical protein
MKAAPLAGRWVGISISESPDMAVLGLGVEHLQDAMSEVARHLIACGASLAYGGDLREGGFTEVLFEIVERYRSRKDEERILVENYLAWPVHVLSTPTRLQSLSDALKGLADLVLLTPDGSRIEFSDRPPVSQPPTEEEWSAGLTAMRKVMGNRIYARIALGGRTSGYKGKMPGIAEEALIQLRRKAPLYILGGFGGCSLAIAKAMGLAEAIDALGASAAFPGLDQFERHGAKDLHNGLTPSENRLLATTVHIDQAAALILRGLMKLKPPTPRPRKKRS